MRPRIRVRARRCLLLLADFISFALLPDHAAITPSVSLLCFAECIFNGVSFQSSTSFLNFLRFPAACNAVRVGGKGKQLPFRWLSNLGRPCREASVFQASPVASFRIVDLTWTSQSTTASEVSWLRSNPCLLWLRVIDLTAIQQPLFTCNPVDAWISISTTSLFLVINEILPFLASLSLEPSSLDSIRFILDKILKNKKTRHK